MLLSLFLSAITIALIHIIFLLIRKNFTKESFGWFPAFAITAGLAIGSFIFSLFLIDVFVGIGPDILSGKIPATSAIRMSFFSFALAAWYSWKNSRANQNSNQASD